MSFLWKPFSEGGLNPGGTSVLISSGNASGVAVFGPNGQLIENFSRSPSTENGVKYYSRRPGNAYPPGTVVAVTRSDGTIEKFTIPQPGLRYEGNSPESLVQVNKGPSGPGGAGFPGATTPGGLIPGTYVPFPYTADPSQIQFPTIQYVPIQTAPYNFVDPLESVRKTGGFNLNADEKSYQLARKRTLELQGDELANAQGFASSMADLQRQLVGVENAFNRTQKADAVNFAIPGLRDVLRGKYDRANTLAQGRLVSSAEDRAYQLAAESVSIDGTTARGFGDNSLFGKRTSDLLTAQQRLQLSQVGESGLNTWIELGANLLLDQPLKANISQRLPTQSPVSSAQLTNTQQQQTNALTTVNPVNVLNAEIGQEQFRTNLEQNTRQFNSSNQLATDQFNANGTYSAIVNRYNAQVGNFDRINAALGLAGQDLKAQDQAAANAASQGNAVNAAAAANNANASGVASGTNTGAAVGGTAAAVGAVAGAVAAGANAVTAINGNGGGQTQSVPTSVGTDGNSVQDVSNIAQQQGLDPQQYPVTAGQFGQNGITVQPDPETGTATVPDGFTGIEQNADGSVFAVPSREASLKYQQSRGGTTSTAGLVSAGQNFGNAVANVGIAAGSPQLTQVGQVIATAANAIGTFTSGTTSGSVQQTADKLSTQFQSTATSDTQRGEIKTAFNDAAEAIKTGAKVTGLAADAALLISGFNNLSDAQKYKLGVNLFLHTADAAKALGLTQTGSASILATKVPNTSLTVGNALSLANAGINIYTLINNWDQLSTVDKALLGTNSALSVVQTAQSLGLLGTATPAATAATSSQLAAVGAQSAASYGPGAISVSASQVNSLPAGYTVIASEGSNVVAIPNAVIGASTTSASTAAGTSAAAGTGAAGASAAGAGAAAEGGGVAAAGAAGEVGAGAGAGSAAQTGGGTLAAEGSGYLATASGVVAIGAGAYTLYKGWGVGGAEGRKNGAIGGTAIVAGLYTLGALSGPYGAAIAAGIIVGSIALESIHTGKSGGQMQRDALRSRAQDLHLSDENHQVTLADGSKFDIGIDGHGGQRPWFNTSYIRPDQRDRADKPLNAWDVDYTKDIDAITQISGQTLAAIMDGGKGKFIHQFGNQVTNAAVSNVGTDKLTFESFSKSMDNMQKFFHDIGIGNKTDAYALLNQMFGEGRINQVDLYQLQVGANLAFDDRRHAFADAERLLQGVQMGRQGLDPEGKPEAVPGEASPSAAPPGFGSQPPGQAGASGQQPLPRPTPGNGSGASLTLTKDPGANLGPLTPAAEDALNNAANANKPSGRPISVDNVADITNRKPAKVTPVTRPTFS